MTKIEWCKNPDGTPGVSWSPVTGCTPISEGCKNCWARTMARRLQAMGKPGYENGFKVTVHVDRWGQPLRWKKPRMIFVCSMGDLFHEDVSLSIIGFAHTRIRGCTRHTFQVLTKRPERFADTLFRNIPANCWLGVTVESQDYIDRIKPLLEVKGPGKRFVSVEPMLGRVKIPKRMLSGLDWVIIGCESLPGGRVGRLPSADGFWGIIKWRDYAKALVSDCRDAKVPVFIKQIPDENGMVLKDVSEFPPSLRYREFPT